VCPVYVFILFIYIFTFILFSYLILRVVVTLREGLISLWLYKENNKLRDSKKCIYSTYSPLSSTHLWLRCSNFFNPSKKNSFDFAADRKIGKAKDLSALLLNTIVTLRWEVF
jgi:hypothetical protein